MKSLKFKKHIIPGKCHVVFCKNKCKGKMCSSCRSKKCRQSDPVRYAFNNIRNRAKQRGLPFTITLDQFRQWCVKVNYIGFKGRSSESYTIDRKHNDIGYHIDNIQIMTKRDNVIKFFSYDWRTKQAGFWTPQPDLTPKEQMPF